jgi:hypothetical protein
VLSAAEHREIRMGYAFGTRCGALLRSALRLPSGQAPEGVCRHASWGGSSDGFAGLAEAVFSFDLIFGQAADAGQGPAAVG